MQQTTTDKLESILRVKKIPSQTEREFFQKTQDFVSYIKWIPGIRMIAVSNSLAMYATHPESDIDLFIITSVNRLWIVRTFVLIIATILGVRTKKGDEAGKFCFPFFMTEKNLSLEEIAIERDIYLAYWIQTLKPIFNTRYTYGRFMEENHVFYENTLDLHPTQEDRAFLLQENRVFLLLAQKHPYLTKIGELLSPLLTICNIALGGISKHLIEKKIPTKGSEGIFVHDDMVKIHTPDRRQEIRDIVLGTNE